ncbi:hypothetical protein, partial [Shewanella sp.]|uniref:hypothetical protein n=1 Tax=Shewanella sp. TaxID=50422 RepID=UPI00257DDDD5
LLSLASAMLQIMDMSNKTMLSINADGKFNACCILSLILFPARILLPSPRLIYGFYSIKNYI